MLLGRVALVGNAPVAACHAAAIDAHDTVVRCNNAVGYGAERGARCDALVLINCGGQMAEWLATETIERSPAFRTAPLICLPIHPAKARLISPPLTRSEWEGALAQDHTEAATDRFVALGKSVCLFDARFFAESVHALGHSMRRDAPAPSTGYLAARWWLEREGALHVSAFGFGFAGWEGHDFLAERRWFAARQREGRLSVRPSRTDAPNASPRSQSHNVLENSNG